MFAVSGPRETICGELQLVDTWSGAPSAQQETRRPRFLWLAVVPDILALATTLLILVTIGRLNNGIAPLLRQHGEKFATHAVMAAGVSEGQAISTAEHLQALLPGLQAHVIGEAEARGLLALQEPWVRNLPEMELSRLPLMIELRHPKLLEEPNLQDRIEEALAESPDVEFSIFNTTGFENMLEFSGEVNWYRFWLIRLIGGGILLLLFLYAIRLGVAAVSAPFPGLVGRVLIASVLGSVLAFVSVALLNRGTVGHFEMPVLGMARQLVLGSWCAAILLVGSLVPRLTRRRI